MRRAAQLSALAAACLASTAARAHGPTPAAQLVLFDDADPSFVYVASTVFGHFVSHDGGESYGWICSDLFADGTIESFPVGGAVLAGAAARAIVVSGSAGLMRSTDDGCTWTLVDAFDGKRTSSVAVDPADLDRLWVTTAQGGEVVDNALYESLDAGATWQPTSLSGPHFFRSFTLGADGSWWVASFHTEEQVSYLHRSVDAGMTWTAEALPDLSTRSYRIVGVSPTATDAVLLAAGTTADDVLVLAEQAGLSTEVVLEPELPLFETRFDGDAIVIGDEDGGAWISTDGGHTWAVQSEAPGQRCYVEHGGALYACGRQLEDQLAIAVSVDDGQTWEPWFRYEQMDDVLACLGDTELEQCTVGDRFLAQCFELDEWGVNIDEIAGCPELPTFGDSTGIDGDGSGGSDGGSGQTDDGAGGCACAAGRAPIPAWTWLLLPLTIQRRRR